MITKIRDVIQDIIENGPVKMQASCYGLLPPSIDPESWDYIVYNRGPIRKSGDTKNNFLEMYYVNIICEDAIPVDYIYYVIGKLTKIPGLRLADSDIQFDYTTKKGSDLVVEVATIPFYRPYKWHTKVEDK